MKILILAGGTGSIALQTGIYEFFEKYVDAPQVTVLTNAYDNGLSTGLVRRVYDGKILGPSDVRKNQTIRHRLIHGETPLLKFLDKRFTIAADQAREYVMNQIAGLFASGGIEDAQIHTFQRAAFHYFKQPLASVIDYEDFSLANIIYAGLSGIYGNSLRAAAREMASILDIPDRVILNSDESLFLNARTARGKVIRDEGELVKWNNPDDPILETFLTDGTGTEVKTKLCDEARAAILEADMIISSSGTQFSSLIPTYQTAGFPDAYARSNAHKFIVMNRTPDGDTLGISATGLLQTIANEISVLNVTVLIDSTADAGLNHLDTGHMTVGKVVSRPMGHARMGNTPKTHIPNELAKTIFQEYFHEALQSKHFAFDYDDTLVGRGTSFPKSTAANRSALFGLLRFDKEGVRDWFGVCTGNAVNVVNLAPSIVSPPYSSSFTADFTHARSEVKIPIFADGGVNRYEVVVSENVGTKAEPKFIETISKDALFKDEETSAIISTLVSLGINPLNIENRGNATISIKPVDPTWRPPLTVLLTSYLDFKFKGLVVNKAGRSTIDICKKNMHKGAMVKWLDAPVLTYVGDELASGNDAPVLKQGKKVIPVPVRNPIDTFAFLVTLSSSRNG